MKKKIIILTSLVLVGIGSFLTFKICQEAKLKPSKVAMSCPLGMHNFLDKMTELLWASRVYAEPAKADPAYDLLKKGDEYYKQGKYNDAIKCYEELITKYPNSEYAIHGYTGLVVSWGYKGRYEADKEKQKEYYEKSIDYAKQIINKYPNDYNALVSYGAIAGTYFELKNYEKAVIWNEKTLQKYTEKGNREDISYIMICLVSCYCLNEEFEKALNMSKKLIDEYSDTEWVKSLEGEIYVIIGEIYAELEKFDKSIEYLKIGLEKAKGPLDKGVPCFEIGYVYEYGKGNIEQAKVWYRKVIDEYPNSEAVVEARKRLEELENKD